MISPFIDDAIKNDREIKDFVVGCRCSGEVVWFRLPTEWTEDEANQQIADAKAWFRKYCIELTFQKFALDPTLPGHDKRKKDFESLLKNYETQVAGIPKGKIESGIERQLKEVQNTVEDIYKIIESQQKEKIEQQKKKTKDEKRRLVVLFLDEWYTVVPGEGLDGLTQPRRNRVSANHKDLPLIALDRYDRGSRLLLAHELAHGLRKPFGGGNKNCIENFLMANSGGKVKSVTFRSWEDHYAGANQDRAILFISRAAAFQPYAYNQNHVFTVREYLTVVGAGYLTCVEGCEEKKETQTPFYLTDMSLDLSEAAHLTPGLRYQLLRDAPFSSEFREVVKEGMPDMGVVNPPNLEEPPSSFGVDKTSIEMPTPQVSTWPVQMPVPPGSVSWPEMPTLDSGVNPFYLTDLMLDLTAVPDMTPGLNEMTLYNLSSVAFPLPVFWQKRPTFLLRMNGSDEETKISPDEKIMEFGELEEDAMFGFVKEGLVDTIFKYVEENVNPRIPKLPKFLKLPLGETQITKEQVKAAVDTVNPELVTNFTCTGNCENFDSIQIEQQAPKLYGPKSGGTTIPVIDVSLSLTLEAEVITAPAKVISPCITEQELDFRRKSKEAEKAAKELSEYAKKKAAGEKVGKLPAPPEFPKPPKERTKPGRQVQQDFIIKWDVTIRFSLLEIEYTKKLYKQTVTRFSSCCQMVPGALPIPPSPVPEGEEEDGKEEQQKEFFFAGFQDLGETVSDYFLPFPAPPSAIPEDVEREEGGKEDLQRQPFFIGFEDIAVSAEALATKFMAPGITMIPTEPTENAVTNLNIKEVPPTRLGSKTPSEDT